MLTSRSIQAALREAAPLSTPRARALRRAWSRQLYGVAPAGVIALAEALAPLGFWERFVGYELLVHHPGSLRALQPTQIRRLGRGLTEWAGVDTYACYLAGPAWREGLLPTSQIHRWARSRDRWARRTAVVCTVALNVAARGGTGDARRTLGVCRLVVADRDDMVVKALSWALRSLVSRDRSAVESFLTRHGADLASRVRREVEAKLRTGRKRMLRSS